MTGEHTLLSRQCSSCICDHGSASEVDTKDRLVAGLEDIRDIKIVLPELIVRRRNMLTTQLNARKSVEAVK